MQIDAIHNSESGHMKVQSFLGPQAGEIALNLRPISVGEFDRLPIDARMEGGKRIDALKSRHSDSDDPLVSVITVCRNADSTIRTAIQSVLSQTYENIELIILDGLSDDDTLSIIREYADKIEYFASARDGGIYPAMNHAISLAKGKYLALLNADDHFFPEFIQHSVEALENTDAEISYCNYQSESGAITCPPLNPGLLFTQLNIKHNTFLFDTSVFDRIGGFDERYDIVADAKWNRSAYLAGVKFVQLEQELVFYSSQGASSSATEERKQSIIRQSADLIREVFGFLDQRECEAIYTSNFNAHSLKEIRRLYQRYEATEPLFAAALKRFMEFNLQVKQAYIVNSRFPDRLCDIIDICDAMGISFSTITFDNEDDYARRPLLEIQRIARDFTDSERDCVVHFARKFSSPSEPFIPNFVNELVSRQPGRRHVFLCDERLLEDERPFDDSICIPWPLLRHKIRQRLYDLLWDKFEPTLIISHFALNAYWLHQRLPENCRDLPTINICHGVDVFAMVPGGDYFEYIKNFAIPSPNVCFTAVSQFLVDQLIAAGVPESKVFKVNNALVGDFAQHRKEAGFFDRNKPLRIVSVGRLIAWKGHAYLLDAIAQAKTKIPEGVEVSLVYGNWDEELENLTNKARTLGLLEHIKFVPFVNFAEEPDYLSRFDLFVLPSTLSEDTPPRTETFGVALLEAIVSGLPVITTDAGGLPEVIGEPNEQAVVVPHGNAEALADALVRAVENHERVFASNKSYADDRLQAFSTEKQYARWLAAENWFNQDRVKIYHFMSLTSGGAAGAALNIHRALCERGYASYFVTQKRGNTPPYIPNLVQLSPEISFDFDQAQVKDRLKHRHTIFSIDDQNMQPGTIADLVKDADIVNLPWFAQFLSSDDVTDIANSGIPVMITLRDMYPITGGCHYFHGCERWKADCASCPQLIENEDDFPKIVLQNKVQQWNDDSITFVALSDHSKAILETSAVAKNRRIEKISNFVDSSTFYLEGKYEAREEFGFPRNAVVVGYLPSFNSLVKGHDELTRALKRIAQLDLEREIVIALAADAAESLDKLPFQISKIGKIHDNNRLRAFYNAADVIAVPSLEETFSNTTVEAIACGTPVVGFKTGILAELAEESKLGSIVEVGDDQALAEAIVSTIESGQSLADRQFRSQFAAREFSKQAQINKYDRLIRALIGAGVSRRDSDKSETRQAPVSSKLLHLRMARKSDGAKRRLSGVARRTRDLSRQNNELKQTIALMLQRGKARREGFDRARQFAKSIRLPTHPLLPDKYMKFDQDWIKSQQSFGDHTVGRLETFAKTVISLARDRGPRESAGASLGLGGSRIPRAIKKPPNFDEARYLSANPDVKATIESGHMPSAYYHYVAFGRLEGRHRETSKK